MELGRRHDLACAWPTCAPIIPPFRNTRRQSDVHRLHTPTVQPLCWPAYRSGVWSRHIPCLLALRLTDVLVLWFPALKRIRSSTLCTTNVILHICTISYYPHLRTLLKLLLYIFILYCNTTTSDPFHLNSAQGGTKKDPSTEFTIFNEVYVSRHTRTKWRVVHLRLRQSDNIKCLCVGRVLRVGVDREQMHEIERERVYTSLGVMKV